MTETKFCTGCQSHRSIDGGSMRKCRKTARWVCKMCAKKETKSIYASNKPTSKATLDQVKAMLYGSVK